MVTLLAQDFGDTMQSTLDQVVSVAVKVIVFLVILLVGWLIARVLRSLADRLLDKIGLNRAARRSGLERWTGQYTASALLAKLLFYTVLLIALHLGFGVFGPNPISDLISGIIAWLPHLFVALIILVVATAIASAVFDVVSSAMGSLSYGRVVARIAQVAIIVLGVIAALNQIGIATSVTTPVLIAVLATIGGILVVGLGGGLIGPMRQRWERILARVEGENTTTGTGG